MCEMDVRKLRAYTCWWHFGFILLTIRWRSTHSTDVAEVWMDPRYPWTFDNDLFGGPDFWGLVHKNWRMCAIGRLQSPINIDPAQLLFDPRLTRLEVATHAVEATLVNTGQLPLITLENTLEHADDSFVHRPKNAKLKPSVNISGGPAYPYTYHLSQVIFHHVRGGDWSSGESEDLYDGGSEHTINGVRFPAEIQLMAYNSDLYENFSQAMFRPRGLLGISIIVDENSVTNPELRRLTVASQSITYKGSKTLLKKFQPGNLLPKNSDHYVTYEGSLTYPGCYETVTWVILNRPLYITREDLAIWSRLQSVERNMTKNDSNHRSTTLSPTPALYSSPNHRPLQPDNGRLIRTNINLEYRPETDALRRESCPSNIYLDMGYRSRKTGRGV